MSVVIETTIGDITLDLFHEERPRTCLNFLKLCKMKYYNLNLIYSIERNFLAQMGDPSGTGRGGSSIFSNIYGEQARFYEGEKVPVLKHRKIGTVSMVSCSKDHLFGSQFFITLGEDLDSLDDEHLVFGEVSEGLEILEKFNKTLTDDSYRPYQDIRITHTVVLHDPFPDPEQLEYPDRSPSPTEAMLESNYIAADEEIDDNEGRSLEEIVEQTAAKEAQARATILEMVGDLPDAEVAPAENVLFVCKLNPVTTSEDLEIIFSRFGKIRSCEIIIDKVTKNSLQYGFIEFSNRKSCEDAYFKMDNVLIDDRRIHVDFNQSVSRLRWKGKGRIEYFDDQGRRTNDPTVFNPNKISRKGDSKKKNRDESHTERRHHSPYSKTSRYDKDRRNTNHDRRRERDISSNYRDRDKKYDDYHSKRKEYVHEKHNSRYSDRREKDPPHKSREYESRRKDLDRSKDRRDSRSVEREKRDNKRSAPKNASKERSKKQRKSSDSPSSSSSDSADDSPDEKTIKLMKKLKKEIKKSKKKKKRKQHSKKKKNKKSKSSSSSSDSSS